MQDRIPFTYLIGWSNLNKYYYGVRYAKDCHPDDLWNTYFTSSKIVQQFRELNGEPDIVQIRHIFESRESALEWEYKFLMKVNALKSDKWLNANIKGLYFSNLGGRNHSIETRKKLSISRRKYLENRTQEQIERDLSVRKKAAKKSAEKISKKAKERFSDKEYKEWFVKEIINSPERKEKYKKSRAELEKNEEYKEKWLSVMRSSEYREKQRKISKDIWSDENRRKEQSERLKSKMTEEYKQQMSENAKKSSGNRLATKYINQIPIENLSKMSENDLFSYLDNLITKFEYDKERALKKFKEKISACCLLNY